MKLGCFHFDNLKKVYIVFKGEASVKLNGSISLMYKDSIVREVYTSGINIFLIME